MIPVDFFKKQINSVNANLVQLYTPDSSYKVNELSVLYMIVTK